jgi:hypothetical protein
MWNDSCYHPQSRGTFAGEDHSEIDLKESLLKVAIGMILF